MASWKLALVVFLFALVVIVFWYKHFISMKKTFSMQLQEEVSSMEDCELHRPTIQDFCCEVYEEDLEFMDCLTEWTDKLDFPESPAEEMVMHFCIAECTYNETDFLKKDGYSLDLKIIKNHLDENYDSQDEASLMFSTFKKCEKHAKDMLKHEEVRSMKKLLAKEGCKPYAGIVMECVTNELILNCPKDKWNDSAQCEHAKEFLQKCVK